MKAIFTYPLNAGTSYIDPDYIGDDTVGFQKRIKELVDGTYKAWEGTIPSDTVTNIMSELSKFNQFDQFENASGNNEIHLFWKRPLFSSNMEVISSDILSASASTGVTSNVEFSGNHGFYDEQYMTLSGFDGSWATLNGNSYYVKKIDSDTIQLATDTNLTNLIEFYALKESVINNASVGGVSVFTDADGSHTLVDGTYVELSNFNNAFDQYNGENFYVQNTTTTTFNLSWDAAGTDLLTLSNTNNDVEIESITLENDNSELIIKLVTGSTQFPDGTEVLFDPNNTTVYGDSGPNTGLSTELSNYTANSVYLEATANPDEYKAYTLSGATKIYNVWPVILTNTNGYVEAGKHATVNFERAGNDYIYRYTFSNTGGVDLTGNKSYVVGPGGGNSIVYTDSAINSPPLSTNYPYYIQQQDPGGSDYYLYNDVARTDVQSLDYDILNAKRIKHVSTDPRVHISKQYDSAGVEIDATSFVLNTDTIDDITEVDYWEPRSTWTYSRANNIDNVPTRVGAIEWSRRTATYGPGAEVILDFDNAAVNDEVTQDFDTSSFTNYQAAIELSGVGGSTYKLKQSVNTGPWDIDPIRTKILSMYNANPDSVFSVPFVFECGNVPSSTSSSFTATGTYYGWVTHITTTTPGSEEIYFRINDAEDNGAFGYRGGFLKTYGPDPFQVPTGGVGVFRTYLEQMYDRPDPTTSTGTFQANNWRQQNLRDEVSFIVPYDIYAGQKCSIRIVRTSDNVLMHTETNLAFLNASFNQGAIYSTFCKLDGSGKYDPSLNNASGDASLPFLALYDTATYDLYVDWSTDTCWTKTSNIGLYEVPIDNYFIVSGGFDATLTNGFVNIIQTDVPDTDVTTFDTTGTVPWVAATQGDVVEATNPATPNIIPVRNITAATTGTLTIEANQDDRYRVASVSEHMYGNVTYMQRTGASTYVNNAQVTTGNYIYAGATEQQYAYEHWPSFTVPTDSSGYLISGFSFDSEFPGAFPSGEDHMWKIQSVPDTYTPPAPTPAEEQDIFDTDDEWTNYGFANKTWPEHVTPRSAKIVYNSPTIVNNSQNGIKYTRSVGHTNWRLEVTYPAMTAEEFQIFHAVAQAGQGQAMPFFFNLRGREGESILWRDFWPGGTTNLKFKDPVALGDTTALLEGYSSNESNAFTRGEVFIDGKNENGRLHTTLNTVDANIYGEAKIRTTWPFREAQQVGWSVFRNPLHAVVTLDNDNFEYSVGTDNYYYVSVGFDLDSWK